MKNRFSKRLSKWPSLIFDRHVMEAILDISRKILAIFDLQVTPILPTVNWPRGVGGVGF